MPKVKDSNTVSVAFSVASDLSEERKKRSKDGEQEIGKGLGYVGERKMSAQTLPNMQHYKAGVLYKR